MPRKQTNTQSVRSEVIPQPLIRGRVVVSGHEYTPAEKMSAEDFERALMPSLKGLHGMVAPVFCLRVWELVQEKQRMENLLEEYKADQDAIRRQSKIYRSALAKVRASLKLQGGLTVDRSSSRFPGLSFVEESNQALRKAEEQLKLFIEDILPNGIHPKFRRGGEKRAKRVSPHHEEYRFEFGVAKLEYWLIHEIDQLFDAITLTPQLNTVVVGRDAIIKAVLEIAFEKYWDLERIKTARLRKRTRRRPVTSASNSK